MQRLAGRQLEEPATGVGAGPVTGDVLGEQVEELVSEVDRPLAAVLRGTDLDRPASRALDLTPDGQEPAQTERHDHRCELSAGATLLLYTDGLVERRGKSLDEGIAWLAGTLADAGADGPEVCATFYWRPRRARRRTTT